MKNQAGPKEQTVTIYNIMALFGGLAFFLFGMSLLSTSLEKMAGGGLEKLLKKVTDNPFMGLVAGAIITIAIQSSSATTVMLVGFVNSGIMSLSQTVSVIFGADIGTTLTAWILSLTGLDDGGGSILVSMLQPKNFSMVFALVGVILIMTSRRERPKDIGSMLFGFAILMFGMTMMSDSMAPLADLPQFARMMSHFNNPLVGVLVGALITGVIQSSAASIGVLQGLSMTGQITLGMAIPIVMGANIGTCMTAILACIGVNRKAKRVAAVHISIKIIGTILWLVIFYGLDLIFNFTFLDDKATTFNIALFHTIFNVVNTLVLFWFPKWFEKLAYLILPDTEEEEDLLLDDRLMATPGIALPEVENAMDKMVKKARKGLDRATGMVTSGFDRKAFDKVKKNEQKIDSYEDRIGAYLMKLTTTQQLTLANKRKATKILQGIGEIERLADHAWYIARSVSELNEKKLSFSKSAIKEEDRIIAACQEIYQIATDAFMTDNAKEAKKAAPLSSVIYSLVDDARQDHVNRLASGKCQARQGFIYSDLLYSYERIASHCRNICAIVLRVSDVTYDADQVSHDFRIKKTPEDERLYDEYYEIYAKGKLPDPKKPHKESN